MITCDRQLTSRSQPLRAIGNSSRRHVDTYAYEDRSGSTRVLVPELHFHIDT